MRYTWHYGVPSISRLLKIIGLFCNRALLKRIYFAKETYNFKGPTNRSHPIPPVWHTSDATYLQMWYTWDIPEMWDTWDVRYLRCEIAEMWDSWDVRYLRCEIAEMQYTVTCLMLYVRHLSCTCDISHMRPSCEEIDIDWGRVDRYLLRVTCLTSHTYIASEVCHWGISHVSHTR